MKTGGYDVLIELNERLVNHVLAAAFYSSFYTNFEGSVVPKVGGPLGDLARIDYRLELNEPPMIDFVPEDMVRVRLGIMALIKIIGRKVRTDVSADLLGRMKLDPVTKEVSLEVLEVKLGELRFLDRYELPHFARTLINEAMVLAIHSSYMKGVKREGGLREVTVPITAAPQNIHLGDEIKIALLPGFPGMTIKVPSIELDISSLVPAQNLDMGEVDMPVFPGFFGVISEHSIAMAISMGENVVGVPAEIKDFTEGNDVAIGLSETSLNRILDNVWSQIPRDLKVNGNVPVDNVRELLDSLRGIRDMPSRFEALGLTRKDTEVEKAWVDFSAVINPQKPKFRMGAGGTFEIYDTRAQAKAQATVRAIEVTTTRKGRNAFLSTWFKPKEQEPPKVKKDEITLYNFDSDIEILVKHASVTLSVDPEGRLKLDVNDIDFSLDIPWRLPKFVLEGISNRIEASIREDFPPVDLTEMIQDKMMPMLPFTPVLRMAKVSMEGSEALIIGNLEFKELPRHIVPVPIFVADPRVASREVHRASCPSVHKIPESVQVGYTSLYDALAEGMRGAMDCLPEFSKGLMEKERTLTLPEVDIPLGGRESAPVGVETLKPIPISEGSAPVGPEIVMIVSSQEAADRTGYEVQSEEHQDRPAADKKDAIPPAGKEIARTIDRE